MDDLTVLIFTNGFILDMCRRVCDRFELGYDLNRRETVPGDIIHGLFFGYFTFDIAQYSFLHENDLINLTIKNAVNSLHNGILMEKVLANLIRTGAFRK